MASNDLELLKTKIWIASKENLYCVLMCQCNINFDFHKQTPSFNDWHKVYIELCRLKNIPQ